MRRLGVFSLMVAVALSAPAAVYALSQSSIPAKFGLAWGQNAGAPYIRSIPQTSQIGIQNCAASLNDGFPPSTFTPATAGGCPPFGQDFNGILKQLSQWAQWQSAGGPVFYDPTFASTVGGYPSGAKLASAVTPGTVWMSTADNNTSDPDNGGANWVQDPGQIAIGTPVPSLNYVIVTPSAGYVFANGLTIGNASSNATNRANADTKFLFSFLWNGCIQCSLFTSGGAPTTKGASPAADFAANKAIATYNFNGSGLIGADSQGATSSSFLAGVPVVVGDTAHPGSILGENLHTLTRTEIPTGITSSGSALSVSTSVSTSVSVSVSTTSSASDFLEGGGLLTTNAGTNGVIGAFSSLPTHASVASTGTGTGTGSGSGSGTTSAQSTTSNNTSGGSHNNVERSTIVYWSLKL